MLFTPARRSLAEEGRQPAELEEQNGGKYVIASDLLGIADQAGSLEPAKAPTLSPTKAIPSAT